MVHSADAGAWLNQRLAGDVHFVVVRCE